MGAVQLVSRRRMLAASLLAPASIGLFGTTLARAEAASSRSASAPLVISTAPPAVRRGWGGNGTGNGQLSAPFGLALDSTGNVYVADVANHRIQKFSSVGTYLTQWGTKGTGNGQFTFPHG